MPGAAQDGKVVTVPVPYTHIYGAINTLQGISRVSETIRVVGS